MCRAKKVRAISGEKAALARAVWCAMERSQGGADSGLKSSELYINMRNYALDICLSSLSPLPDRCTHRHGVNGSAPPPTWTGPRSATHQDRAKFQDFVGGTFGCQLSNRHTRQGFGSRTAHRSLHGGTYVPGRTSGGSIPFWA